MKDSPVHSDKSVTSLTLLDRARADDPAAWEEFVRLYRPLVYFWCRRQLDAATAEDITQEVLQSVVKHLRTFEHNGRIGALRAWLRMIARRLMIDRRRELGDEPAAPGGTTAMQRLDQVPCHELAEPTEQELSDEVVLLYHRAWKLIASEYSARDNEIFRRVVENGESPSHVADDLGVTANTVSIVVFRIKKRVRERYGPTIES